MAGGALREDAYEGIVESPAVLQGGFRRPVCSYAFQGQRASHFAAQHDFGDFCRLARPGMLASGLAPGKGRSGFCQDRHAMEPLLPLEPLGRDAALARSCRSCRRSSPQGLARAELRHRPAACGLARRMLATLAERCRETFIVASQPSYLPAIVEVLSASELRFDRETSSPMRRVKHLVFHR